MTKVTIFIPVSRAEHFDRLFASLEMLDCDRTQTNLVVYVDGDDRLFQKARFRTNESKFTVKQCIMRPSKRPGQVFSLLERRKRIANIKNESKELIGECDYVFGIEDDTIVPSHALATLLTDYAVHPFAGFIEGVELGRWGIPYVGAWRTDDPYEPKRIESLMPSRGVEPIDSGGFYCYLTSRENYILHDYAPFGNNALGPDVNYGLWLRQQGFQNYIDWSINCEHRDRNNQSIMLPSTQPRKAAMVLEDNRWVQKLE